MSGYETTADYGMGLVPIFIVDSDSIEQCGHGWTLLILAIRDDRKGNQVRPWMDAL